MFDEEDREIGYALLLAIGVAIVVSIFTIGMAGGTAIGQFGGKAKAAAATATLSVAPEPTGSVTRPCPPAGGEAILRARQGGTASRCADPACSAA